ncbi:SMI1/KNR4 family protein [Streptomyces sp. NPDC086010]|uniref:SMI1/KNR4 family protein n=1 Tax=Streptomyces sp. NPDC086010 TaxID=3365745 RepID=UPI0037CD84BC
MDDILAQLLNIIPAPEAPRQKDWSEVERSLGVAIPADYKELMRVFGGSNWDDYLYVLEPDCPNENYDLVEWAKNRAEDLEDLWEFETKPAELEVEGSRIIPWATTDNGECLYWLAQRGIEAEGWTVMVNEARGDRWEHFPVSCTQFLSSSLDGGIRSNILSSLYPLATHEFRQLGAVQGSGSAV